MVIISLKQVYREIPASVKLFSKRATVILAAWLMIYYPILQPRRIPDKWLTMVTADVTSFALNHCSSGGFTVVEAEKLVLNGQYQLSSDIIRNSAVVISIADGCNAFKLYSIYIGFLLCSPVGARRMAAFAIGGCVAIFILNITRCFVLAWLWLKQPAWVDFAHHYVFILIVYGCIFGLWVWYGKTQTTLNEKA